MVMNPYAHRATAAPWPPTRTGSAALPAMPPLPMPWMAAPMPMYPQVSSLPSNMRPFQQPGNLTFYPAPRPFFPARPPQAKIDATPSVKPLEASAPSLPVGPKALKDLFQNNESVLYAINVRTFGAEDKNNDGQISFQQGENGTFLSSIKRLDELAALGVNTIHLLPILPVGRKKRLGEAGSVYAPRTYHELNPEFADRTSPLSVVEQARKFVQEAHKRGINIMVDVPSCASVDLAEARPDLIARDLQGKPLVPTNWIDILMFQNGQPLVEYFEGFFDLMVNQVGVDGFRVDVARARPAWFWDHFISKYPDHAWLAESYTQEDASPMENIPRDVPESLLKIGFDSLYGQFHIFHDLKSSNDYLRYLIEGNGMLKRAGVGKSFIGSFLTHDDPSLMPHGGVTISLLVSGLMSTQPWTNPYILDGFTTGYEKPFDIFNFRPRPKGQHPEIGRFLKHMLKLRKEYKDVITQGLFIPIPLSQEKDSQVIAFARHHRGKTLLIVANKDINARHSGRLFVPGLKMDQQLANLAPSYGRLSKFVVEQNQVKVDLGPGRFHMFEIDTPDLPIRLNSYR